MNRRHAATRRRVTALTLLAACVFPGVHAGSISTAQYGAERDRAQAAYRNAWDSCKKLQSSARDRCKVEAKGQYQVAKAELEVKYKPTPARDDRVQVARAKAAYRLANAKCGDLGGNARDVCRMDAKASLVAAQNAIQVSRAAVDKGVNSRKANSARSEALEENTDAQFAAARERCGALAGDARSSCLGEAKRKFGKM